jgi:hypothetical protein
MTGSIVGGGNTRYALAVDFLPHSHIDVATGRVTSIPPWLFIHTHPLVQDFPGVPSGIHQENSTLTGDLYALRLEPTRQLGILTIGINNVISNFQKASHEIPFTLALRDPIQRDPDLRPTRILDTHKAAATAFRLMFPKTVTGYFIGDLRKGTAIPYRRK